MTLERSNWFYEGVLMAGGVLSIDRAYFDISGGRELAVQGCAQICGRIGGGGLHHLAADAVREIGR